MIKLPMASLLTAIILMALGAGAAQAQRICNSQLSRYFAETGGAETIIAQHLEDLSRNRCVHKWSGTLAYTGVTAEIVAEIGLTEDVERLWNEVLDGLRIADQALVKLGPDGQIGNHIEVMLANNDVAEPQNPSAYTLFMDDRCNMVILPKSHPYLDEPGTMSFIMAHELFHCVQNASISNYNTTASPWWVEGSAHWFAHMAQPDHVVERYTESANHFERVSLEKPLSAFDYSAWPFFAWLAQHRGNAGAVMLLLKGLPNAPHTNDDIAGLLSPDDWDDFAKKYSAYQIKVTDRVPVDPRPRARLPKTEIDLPNVGDERDYTFHRPKGALVRYKILLAPGDWELSTTSGGSMFLSEIMSSGDPSPAWQEISRSGDTVSLSVGCKGGGKYALVGFGSTATDGDFVLNAKKVDDTCEITCERIPETRDACLYGLWEEVDPVIARDLQLRMKGMIPQARAHGATVELDNALVGFYPDSNVSTVDVHYRGSMNIGGVAASADIRAQGTARWGTRGRRLVICAEGVEMETTVRAGGRSQTRRTSIPRDETWSRDRSYRYSCTGDSLTLTDTATGDRGRMERR